MNGMSWEKAGRRARVEKAGDGDHVAACRVSKRRKTGLFLLLIPLLSVRLWLKIEDT